MKKMVYATLIMSMVLMIGSAFAEKMEPCDECTDALIYVQIYNDPYYQGGTLVSPSSTSDDFTCCPGFLADGRSAHMSFPDTLPFPGTIEAMISLHAGDTLVPYTFVHDWWHQDSLPADSIQIPPMVQACCCTNGVFWKARMFDDATSAWSEWTDVRQVGQINNVYGSLLVAKINTSAFKTIGYGGNMQFDCNDDSIAIYVWDGENEPGREGTMGEFAAQIRTYANNVAMQSDTLILHRWGIPTGIGDKTPNLPREYFISQNTPNPFNSNTAIQYGLPEEAEVHIEVTNLLGQKIATLVDENQSAGYKRLVWDGRDDMGREMPSGVYFYSIRANSFSDKKRAILMK